MEPLLRVSFIQRRQNVICRIDLWMEPNQCY